MNRTLKFLLPLLLGGLIVFGAWSWLRSYTRHGVLMRVPPLRGLTLEEAGAMLAERELQALVIDSVYVEEVVRGAVVEQDPAAGADVKPGRKVYLVMNASQPKMLDMPKLVDLSKRQALSMIDILGLKVKEIQYRPDPCLDCVVAQLYKGEPIPPDARIRHGEAITLVLGSGDKGGVVPVPDLIGLPYVEALQVLNLASLNLGIIVSCDGCNTTADSTLARVYRQVPGPVSSRLALGSGVDVWLTTDTAGMAQPDGRSLMERAGKEENAGDDE